MTTARYAAHSAAQSEPIGWLGRLGLVARGASYGLVAVLALLLALDAGGAAADRGGALQTIAKDGLGRVVVVLLAVGFAGYAIWRFAQAVFDRKGEEPSPRGSRSGSATSAAAASTPDSASRRSRSFVGRAGRATRSRRQHMCSTGPAAGT